MDEKPLFSTGHHSDSHPGSGDDRELLSTAWNQEVNEEMSYRETIRSVCSFMGWTHIPEFDLTYGKDWERANNPWKGKNPGPSVSFALLPDGWLCHKLEKLNLEVLEGYPNRSQDLRGLETNQFVRTPYTVK